MAESYARLTEDDGGKKDPFEAFVDAPNLKEAYQAFRAFCEHAGVEPFEDHATFYERLKAGTSNWKAKELFKELDKKANRKEYGKRKACPDAQVFTIGAGPCGLRMAIELALLGCKVVLVEKRDSFTRNNVLYLWNYLITDLTNLGAKKLYGRFGAGDINHISIIKLQVILLKVALILGVEIHYGVEFVGLDEKPKKTGWRANVKPKDHKVAKFEFTYIIAADGRQNTLPEFEWKESARTLAIGITTNFVNKHSQKDAITEEIAGKAYVYYQDFFQRLKESKNIDLENIVYYKDETHYFVMTAKKTSLLEKGVIKKDEADTNRLLASGNVNHKKLQKYAYEAAFYATDEKLPTDEFAKNYRGEPDIAMFDFTSRKQATQPAVIKEADGKVLVMAVVGDSLKEPFWPEGTGCALGFLGVFDTVWMIRDIATGERTVEQALQTREVVYKLLSNTTQSDLAKPYEGFGIDPRTRYTNPVAKSSFLYKEEPKKVVLRSNSSSDSEDHRQRPVSEFIRKDREENKGRERLHTTAFSMKRKKNQEEAEKRKMEKRSSGEEKTKGSIKEKKEKSFKLKKKDSKKTKEGKGETEKNEAAAIDKKDKDKEKEAKEMKKKQEKEEKAKEKKMKKEKKEEMKKSKKKKKNAKETDEEKYEKRSGRNQPNKEKTIQERINDLQTEGSKSMKEKSRSLDRREVSFSDAFSKFENNSPKSEESSPASSRASTGQEKEELKVKKKRKRWSALKFWKGGESEDDTDGKKKNKAKKKKKRRLSQLKRKLTRKGKKSKTSKREGSYKELDVSVEEDKPHSGGDVSGRSSTSSLGNKASPKSQKKDQKGAPKADEDSADEVDGPGSKNQKYDKMDDSDETISKQTKTDRSSSFLHKLRPKKRKSSKYNSLQMEVERPIGS